MRNRKGQSTAEYALLISLVLAAYVGIQLFVNRGLKAKVADVTEHFTNQDGGESTIGKLSQYEPYYSESKYDVTQNRENKEQYGNKGLVNRDVYEATERKTGGFSRQGSDRTADGTWQFQAVDADTNDTDNLTSWTLHVCGN